MTRIAPTAQKHMYMELLYLLVLFKKASMQQEQLLYFVQLQVLHSYNFPVFPFREKLATFLSAAHTTEIIDLPKQPRGFNYLINLKEDMLQVTADISLSEDLRNASSNTENLLLPVQLRQQV